MGALKACKLNDYPIFIPALTYTLKWKASARDEVFLSVAQPRGTQQQLNSNQWPEGDTAQLCQSRLRVALAKTPEELLGVYTRELRPR